jgi:hypothetical protein
MPNAENKPQPVALVQHPMWLIIKEDTICAERTPPWGAASIDEYAKRLERNLSVLESHPWAKINYDFSAVELADVNAMYPDLGRRIREAITRGRLGVVNGTYSQPHLHTLSLEASVRQFQEGLRIIRELFGYTVRTYLMQEPGYTDQTPQILKAFGFRFAHQGCFITRLETRFEDHYTGREPFLNWRGCDGTEITAMTWGIGLSIPGMPDMTEANLDPTQSYVLLDSFLDRHEKENSSRRMPAKMWIPWSYLEGTDGEQLTRLNTACETALAQMDAATALINPAGTAETGESADMWRTWLLGQHHDAYWSGGPELRAKCCDKLRMIIRRANAIVRQSLASALPINPGDGKDLALFASYPREHRGVLILDWNSPAPKGFVTPKGETIPTQWVGEERNGGRLMVPYHFEGAGYTQLQSSDTPATTPAQEWAEGKATFENDFYRVAVDSQGTLHDLAIVPSGQRLMVEGTREGVLTATVEGKKQEFESRNPHCSNRRGPVATVIESAGSIGPVPVTRRVICFPALPWFEMEIECEFNQTSIGDFYDDDSKLVLRWTLEDPGERSLKSLPLFHPYDMLRLVHGIGGGASVPHEPRRAFFPVNWVDRQIGGTGLALINFGTFKHVWKDHELLTILAWGGDTAHFGNRVDNNGRDMIKQLDLRLSGRRMYRFVVYPHSGDWRTAHIPDLAMSLLRPPLAVPHLITPGKKLAQATLLKLDGTVVPSSVFTEAGRPTIRAYEPAGDDPTWNVEYRGKPSKVSTCDVAGNPDQSVRPWGIYNLRIEP